MNKQFTDTVLKSTGAKSFHEIEVIQNLWSGYGKLVRFGLEGSEYKTVIVKHVKLPEGGNHPRGWNTDISHQRKVKSYKVETAWYTNWSQMCDANCKVPECFATDTFENEVLIVLEDLDAAGYPERLTSVSWNEIELCLSWLAAFHAKYMYKQPENLWLTGTYWHLDTRPEELEVLADKKLKRAASAIDAELDKTPFKSIVHGDAKLANFCFSEDKKKVSAVDFQYVGGGCGMKDVAYFVGSCLYEEDCEKYEARILDYYFDKLKLFLKDNPKSIDGEAVEENWRELYHWAWTDFHRFLKGWSPGHWKINSYSEKITKQILSKI